MRRELAEAYAEQWAQSDQPTRDAWQAFYRMIGGTEEDAKRAEELVRGAKFQDRTRIKLAVKKMLRHRAQTGHKLSLRGLLPFRT